MRKKQVENALADKIVAEVESLFERIGAQVNKNELEIYLKGTAIKTDMVDDSRDITPEQVAILGAYTIVAGLLEDVKTIREGKEIAQVVKKKPVKKSKVIGTVIAMKDGKELNSKDITVDDLPQEVIDALKKFADGLGDK